MMQRRLVLTNEGAGHWLRRMLPPPQSEVREAKAPMAGFKLFGMTFCAAFMAFYGFLA